MNNTARNARNEWTALIMSEWFTMLIWLTGVMVKLMSNEEALEQLWSVYHRLNNLHHAAQLPVSADIHLDGIKPAPPEMMASLKEVYLALGGQDSEE